jgi:hypothetical protein
MWNVFCITVWRFGISPTSPAMLSCTSCGMSRVLQRLIGKKWVNKTTTKQGLNVLSEGC